ncbi:MAG: casein kinase II regulatory subunit-domain-containing protein [Olpidium bornovanus]|uniref:Casein kinase II subunit beta n=1 Tax=Olpidium bornovanus TaxID=278681 RepID=A0A8H8DJE5_9FUNG|nr:MAG: casein kinase II regulatory subunit-domain-containing protein [Olpidium bornovanus]
MNEMDRAIRELAAAVVGLRFRKFGLLDRFIDTGSSFFGRAGIEGFLPQKGREFFCEVEEEYILDRFNLTGLNTEVKHYSQAIDLITDALGESHNLVLECSFFCELRPELLCAGHSAAEDEMDDALREEVEKSAIHVYGLIHARYIITQKGLEKMVGAATAGGVDRHPRAKACEVVLPEMRRRLPTEVEPAQHCGWRLLWDVVSSLILADAPSPHPVQNADGAVRAQDLRLQDPQRQRCPPRSRPHPRRDGPESLAVHQRGGRRVERGGVVAGGARDPCCSRFWGSIKARLARNASGGGLKRPMGRSSPDMHYI